MTTREFLFLEFYGAEFRGSMSFKAETPEDLPFDHIGEKTEIIVKHKPRYARRHPVTHIHAKTKAYFYAVIELEDFILLQHRADAQHKDEQIRMNATERQILAENRTYRIEDLPVSISSRIREDPNGCWRWTGQQGSFGYGRIRIGKKSVAAHRYVYEMLCGPIPAGAVIRHKCDVASCVNPAHLLPGTPKQNYDDMVERRRTWQQLSQDSGKRWIEERYPKLFIKHFDHLPPALQARINIIEIGCWEWKSGDAAEVMGWYGRSVKPRCLIFEKLARRLPHYVTLERACSKPNCVNPKHVNPLSSNYSSDGGRGFAVPTLG